MTERRILVLNSHEAWVAQLDGLPFEMDIVVGLAGRYHRGWDERMRPVPRNARLVTLSEALANRQPYWVAVGHSITDLLEIKSLELPKLFVLHTTLEGRLVEQPGPISAAQLAEQAERYLKLIRGHVIAISELKRASWRIPADIVHHGIRVTDYPEATQEKARGLRICNHFNRRRTILLADFHEACFSDLPVEFIGENQDMPGVAAASDWADLKTRIAASRFYVHTADPRLEDGFNLASLEAMASGLPVIGNAHPTSIVEHGKSGFVSDDPEELRSHAKRLLDDRALSLSMGRAARKRVAELFSHERFEAAFVRSLKRAREKYFGKGAAQKTGSKRKKRR